MSGEQGGCIKINTATKSESGIINYNADPDFSAALKKKGVQNLTNCIQCMRCGVGCPIAFAMDYNPTQIIRMAILGMKEEALNSKTIWLCSACETCTTRCPMDIDVAGVMDAIKEVAVDEGVAPAEKDTKTFHDVFMGIIKSRGRMNEPMLFGHYKLRTRTFTKDMDLGMQMVKKGKIKYSGKIKNNKEIRKIFDRITRKP